jgi:hypothetical protein
MPTPEETLNQEKESSTIRNRLHTIAYFLLREKLNEHIIDDIEPILTEIVRFLGGINWKSQSEILQQSVEKENRKRAKSGAYSI